MTFNFTQYFKVLLPKKLGVTYVGVNKKGKKGCPRYLKVIKTLFSFFFSEESTLCGSASAAVQYVCYTQAAQRQKYHCHREGCQPLLGTGLSLVSYSHLPKIFLFFFLLVTVGVIHVLFCGWYFIRNFQCDPSRSIYLSYLGEFTNFFCVNCAQKIENVSPVQIKPFYMTNFFLSSMTFLSLSFGETTHLWDFPC